MAVAHRSTTTAQFTSATTLAVNLPGSITAGELLLIWAVCLNTVTDTAWSTPAGWTQAAQKTNTTNGSNRWRGVCFYRVADGSEGATVTIGTLASSRKIGAVAQAYTGVDTTTPMDATAVTGENDGGTTSPTLPSITTATANAMLVGAILGGATGTAGNISSPPMANERVDAVDSSSAFTMVEVTDEAQAATGASGTKAGTSTVNARWIYIMLALRPGGGATLQATASGSSASSGAAAARRNKYATASGSSSSSGAAAATIATPEIVYRAGSAQSNQATSGTTLVLNKPTGTAAGDLLIAAIGTRLSEAIALGSLPSGWALIDAAPLADQDVGKTTDALVYIFGKIAGGSEPSTYTFTWSTGINKASGVALAFTGASTDYWENYTEAGFVGTDPLILGGVTTSGPKRAILHVIATMLAGPNYTPPSGVTELADPAINLAIEVGMETQFTAGTSPSRTFTPATTGRWAGISVALRPASANVRATASGQAQSSGAAAAMLVWRVTAAGASASSGAAAGRLLLKATASGSSASTGAASAKRLLRATTSGSSASSGAAAATRLLRATTAGSSASSGAAAARLLLRATASGTSSSTGAASANLDRKATASGTSQSSGAAGPRLLLKATASGTSASSGAAAGKRLMRATASGTSASTGAAAGTRLLRATTAGTSASSGVAMATILSPFAYANGSSSSTGSASARLLLRATSAGSSASSGAAAATRLLRASSAGSSASTGAAAGRLLYRATASASSTSTGAASAKRLLRGSASGASTSTGSASARRLLSATASALSASTGTASARLALSVTAAGSSSSSGMAAGAITVHRAVAAGVAVSTGTATALVRQPATIELSASAAATIELSAGVPTVELLATAS